MKSNQAYASIRTVLPAAERSEAERSEAERSGAAGKTVADSGAFPRPDPQVVAKAKRRIFTAEYKQRILAEADKAKERPGALGTLLRRESLYSSHLVSWRKERAAGLPQFVDKGGKAVWIAGDGWRHGLGIGRVGELSKCLIGGEEIAPARWGSRLDSRHAQTRQAFAHRIPAALEPRPGTGARDAHGAGRDAAVGAGVSLAGVAGQCETPGTD